MRAEIAPPPVIQSDTGGLRHVVREIARGGLAGLITGFVIGGIGGRIAMRVASLIDGAEHSLKTENGAVIGEFTLVGTLELVIFVGIFTGLGMAVIWVIVQRWLPTRRPARFVASAVAAIALGGRAAIDGRNFDFVILDPPLGQAAIFIVLAGLGGIAIVAVDGWLDNRLPGPHKSEAIVFSVIAILGVLIAVPTIALFFTTQDCGCVNPPRLAGGFLIVVGLLSVVSWVRASTGSTDPGWLTWLGRLSLVGLVIAGLVHLGGEIAHFA